MAVVLILIIRHLDNMLADALRVHHAASSLEFLSSAPAVKIVLDNSVQLIHGEAFVCDAGADDNAIISEDIHPLSLGCLSAHERHIKPLAEVVPSIDRITQNYCLA